MIHQIQTVGILLYLHARIDRMFLDSIVYTLRIYRVGMSVARYSVDE